MKRPIITLILLFSCLLSFAAFPTLDSEKFFGEKYRNNPKTSISIITQPGNRFKSIKVTGDADLVKEIRKAVERDRSKAQSVNETYQNGKQTIIYNIIDNGKVCNLIFKVEGQEATLFIQYTDENSYYYNPSEQYDCHFSQIVISGN